MPADILGSEGAEDLGAAPVEVDQHERSFETSTRTYDRFAHDVAGHQHRLFDKIRLGATPPGRTVEDLVAGRRTVALRVGKAVFVVDDLEFEYGRLANQFLGTLGILNAGELNENIVLAFLDDGRFTHAELVDSIADSLQRLIHRTILNLEHFARGEI